MQNTLIIGGAGYIGTALSDYLLKNDYRLKVLDNCIYNNNGTCLFHSWFLDWNCQSFHQGFRFSQTDGH